MLQPGRETRGRGYQESEEAADTLYTVFKAECVTFRERAMGGLVAVVIATVTTKGERR